MCIKKSPNRHFAPVAHIVLSIFEVGFIFCYKTEETCQNRKKYISLPYLLHTFSCSSVSMASTSVSTRDCLALFRLACSSFMISSLSVSVKACKILARSGSCFILSSSLFLSAMFCALANNVQYRTVKDILLTLFSKRCKECDTTPAIL